MSLKELMQSRFAAPTAGVILACGIIICPLLGTWLLAGILLVCSLHHFFKAVDHTSQSTADSSEAEPDTESGSSASFTHNATPHFDVDAAMAEMTARASRTVRNGR